MGIYKQISINNIILKDYPFKSELVMQAFLIENEELLKLDDKDFEGINILDNEVKVKGDSESGRIDLVVEYVNSNNIAIIELKKDEVNDKTVKQLKGYLEKKETIFKDEYEKYKNSIWTGVVVGTSISESLKHKLTQGYYINVNNEQILIAGIVINRFRGEQNEIIVTTDSYFKNSSKDRTQYNFNNNTYNKGRLVNAVIKEFVNKIKPDVTFSELEKIFSKGLHGTTDIIKSKEDAQKIYNDSGHKRFYIKPEELITLNDGSVVTTSNQWKISNINKFIEKAKELGLNINKN